MPRVPFHRPSVFKSRIAFGIARLLGEVIKQINREVQIEVIHIAGDEMQFSRKLWSERLPILLSIVSQVVAVVAHVERNFAVNLSGSRVPKRTRVPVTAHRPVNSFPGIKLIPLATFAPKYRFKLCNL